MMVNLVLEHKNFCVEEEKKGLVGGLNGIGLYTTKYKDTDVLL